MSWFSSLFGSKKPDLIPLPPTQVRQSDQVSLQSDAIMAKYAKLHRATMLSSLSEINTKRKTLGAG